MTDQTQNQTPNQQQQSNNDGGQQQGGVEFQPDQASGQDVDFEPAQQLEQDAAGSAAGTQQEQFQDTTGQQGGASGSDSRFADQIREHMEVIGADGAHVGTIDHLDGDRIKLTKADSGEGSHEGHHHYLPLSQVSGIEGNQVRLAASGATAYGMESES